MWIPMVSAQSDWFKVAISREPPRSRFLANFFNIHTVLLVLAADFSCILLVSRGIRTICLVQIANFSWLVRWLLRCVSLIDDALQAGIVISLRSAASIVNVSVRPVGLCTPLFFTVPFSFTFSVPFCALSSSTSLYTSLVSPSLLFSALPSYALCFAPIFFTTLLFAVHFEFREPFKGNHLEDTAGDRHALLTSVL